MAKRKTKSTSRKSGVRSKKPPQKRRIFELPELTWPESWTRENVQRAGVVVLWIAAVGLSAWGVFAAVPRLRAYAAAHAPIDVAVSVSFIDAPGWVRGELRETLEHTVLANVTANPLDRTGLARAREALFDTGWFRDVAQVKRRGLDEIEVRGEFVRPFAVVRDRDADHLVDPRGVLLPYSVEHHQASQFIAITGAHFPRPQHAGVPWDGTDVAAAIKLINVIYAQPWRDQVTAVDIADYHQRQQIAFISDRGTRIIWGSAPGQERALEAFADEKLARLNQMFEMAGHIDIGRDLVDLTDQKHVAADPLIPQ